MSIKLMTRVWESGLPTHLKFLLLAMADHAEDDGGHCFPSVARLVLKTGRDRRTIQRSLATLRELGVVEIVAEARQHRPTEYRIRGDMMPPLVSTPGAALTTSRGGVDNIPGAAPTPPEPKTEPSVRTKDSPTGSPKGTSITETQFYNLTRLRDRNEVWGKLTEGGVTKLNVVYGVAAVGEALMRARSTDLDPSEAYPYIDAICRELVKESA